MAEPAPPPTDDPALRAADTVIDLVENVRAKTTGPLLTVARGVVYGLFAMIVFVAIAVLASVALVRIIDVYLPGGVWGAYLIVGGVFCVAGLVLWSQRRPGEPSPEKHD